MNSYVFEVLADPSRRKIVETLRAGECAVNDVVARVAIQQSGVSRHLRILMEAGFVQMRPQGTQRLYSLRAEPFRELDTWVALYRSLWETRLDRFGAALERSQQVNRPAQPSSPTRPARPRKKQAA
ncbi:MAG TPA: metalloregulator ArsR/SmtB family transcription factor [Kofleriaceae bacterium]|nr:metalloregulator ArsR/SmtB family transcription factor [Kofleriaceae bacterium]